MPEDSRKRMTFRRALQILISAGARDIKGQGLGIRSNTDAQRNEVKAAIEVVYEKAYNYPLGENEQFNLGI